MHPSEHPADSAPCPGGRARRCAWGALVALLTGISLTAGGLAAPVEFRSVWATVAAGGDPALTQTIDGVEASAEGWSLGSSHARIAQEKGWSLGKDPLVKQAAIFIPTAPVDAKRFEISLYFLCGSVDKALAQFALFATTDARPQAAGKWEMLEIERFSATHTTLEQISANQLWAVEKPHALTAGVKDPIYHLTASWSGGPVTGFRLDAIPVARPNESGFRMSWSNSGDFVLTEFQVEALSETNTNIARRAGVKASHLLSGNQTPGVLTDGMLSTYAHPWQADLGSSFFFEIDLGQSRALDHLSLRGRGDNVALDRFSRVHVELYDREPMGSQPVWAGVARADGSHPGNGEVEILCAARGQGTFHGRYLRISSNSPVPLSPQLAEVEVYETLIPQLHAAWGDGYELSGSLPLRVPPHTRRLTLELRMPASAALEAPFRWRLRGYHDEWQNERSLLIEMPCPTAGDYHLEAQARHSDGQYNAAILSLPLVVPAAFTQTWPFYALLAVTCLAVGAVFMRRHHRRKTARLLAESALTSERRRIARDMHDQVGAMLSQLSVLQDTFVLNYELPATAHDDLGQLSHTTRQAVQALNDVVWTVNPRHDNLESLADYLFRYADHYLTPVDIPCHLEAPATWPEVVIRAQVRHELVCAFKEALQNIVKHSKATAVEITLALHAEGFAVTVADNGVGLPSATQATGGDGLGNMRNRLATIGGKCDVRTRPQGGTEVRFLIPLPPN